MQLSDQEILDLIDLEAAAADCSLDTPLSLMEVIERGWRFAYAEFFSTSFVEVLAPHHQEAIEWHWNARLALLRGNKPDYWAYFPIWPRGHMKSTVARRIVVMDAVLSIAFDQPAYILYVSRNKDMSKKHASSIETLLASPKIQQYCPDLAQVKRNVQGHAKGWQATFLNTLANVVFHFGGLDEGLAGGNIDDVRPTFTVPDDIDGREESEVISESRFQKLTTEVLPMRQHNTLTFFAQNLISAFGVMYRIYKGHARVLTNRKPTHPIKAVENLKTEKITVDGIVQDVIVAGRPTWPHYNLERAQEEINTIGLPAFKKECQHEVEKDQEGLVLTNYNDDVHVITDEEFAQMFGTCTMPRQWNKYIINDWARSKSKFHANVAAFVTVSSQNSKLPGCCFIFHPMAFPADTQPDTVAQRILQHLSPTIAAGSTQTWQNLIESSLSRTNLSQFVTDTTAFLEAQRNVLAQIIPTYTRPILVAQNVRACRMSHEAISPRNVYSRAYGLPFKGVNPGAEGGIDFINRNMAVDYNLPHAFRPEQKGYTRFYIVVPKEKREYNDTLSPDDLFDHDLIRYQFKHWRQRDPVLSVSGIKEHGPMKANDDFGNSLMMLFHDNVPYAAALSEQELVAEMLPEEVKPATIAAIENEQERINRIQSSIIARTEIENRLNKPKNRNALTNLRQTLYKNKR